MKKRVVYGILLCMMLSVISGCGKKALEIEEVTDEIEEVEETSEEETQEEEGYFEVTDEMYADLLMGNLNKEQFTVMLGIASFSEKTSDYTLNDIDMLVLFEQDPAKTGIVEVSNDGTNYTYELNSINRNISVLTDDIISSSNYDGVNGENVTISRPCSSSTTLVTNIASATYEKNGDMYVEYECNANVAGDVVCEGTKTAVLKSKENGLYQLYEIMDGTMLGNFGIVPDKIQKVATSETETGAEGNDENVETGTSFNDVLDDIASNTNTYGFSDAFLSAETYKYAVYDMDGDGTQELIVGGETPDGRFMREYFYVFAMQGGSAVLLGTEYSSAGILLQLPGKNGICYVFESSVGNGEVVYHMVTYDGNQVLDAEYLRKTIGEASEIDSATEILQVDISDRSLLN